VAREAGACVESLFPTVLADGDFASVDLTSADYAQIADLVNTYASIPLGTSDASDVPIAEPLALTDVASLDRRHPQRWSGRARGCADPSALKSVNDSALRGRVA
jgi:hypothetical protein